MNCKAIKKDGTPCQALAVAGREYCFFHDPEKADIQQAARSKGGQQNVHRPLQTDVGRLPLRDAGSVVAFLEETVNDVRTGSIDARVGNCLGYLAGVVLKALEHSELEERVAALEEKAKLTKKRYAALHSGLLWLVYLV